MGLYSAPSGSVSAQFPNPAQQPLVQQPYAQQYYAPAQQPVAPDYGRLGGWLLALLIFFSVGMLGGLINVVMRLSYSVVDSLISLVALIFTAALVYMISTKNRAYLIAFYCVAGLNILAAAVGIPSLMTEVHAILNSQLTELNTLYSSFGINNFVAIYDRIIIGAMIFGLVVGVGEYVGMWFYFRKSKRVAVYFDSK